MSFFGKIIWRLLGKPEEKEFRRKFPIFVICLLISAFVWGLIKLSRVYEEPIDVRLEFVNQPVQAVVSHHSDTVVFTQVKADGFRLLMWKLHIYPSVIRIDLRKLPMSKSLSDSPEQIQLPAIQVVKSMSLESKLPGVISKIYPETFEFEVTKRHKKMIAVVPKLDLDFAPQYKLYSHAVCEPDSISVSGSLQVLEGINAVSTELLRFKRMDNDAQVRLALVNKWVSKGVYFSHPDAMVSLDVENYTEASIDLPIALEVTGTILGVKTFPDRVKLAYQIALKDYKRIDTGDFHIRVRYNHKTDSELERLPVEVITYPPYIQISRVIPDKVEFVLIK